MTKKFPTDGGRDKKGAGLRKRGARSATNDESLETVALPARHGADATTKAADSVMDLFQQRLSGSGLPIAPQFLSAARRAELAGPAATIADSHAEEIEPDSMPDVAEDPQYVSEAWPPIYTPSAPQPVTVFLDFPDEERSAEPNDCAAPLDAPDSPALEKKAASVTQAGETNTPPADLTGATSQPMPPRPPTVVTQAHGTTAPRAAVGATAPPVRGVIATDSLVFPEIARPRTEGNAPRNELDTLEGVDFGHVEPGSIFADERGAPLIDAPSHTAKRLGDHWRSRWWLAPTIGIAFIVSLFVFDYRALLENRAAPITGHTPRAAAIRPSTGSDETWKSISLPSGKQIEARSDGPIANLVDYLANRAAPLGQTFVLDEITFERDTSDLSPNSEPQIRQIAQVLHA